MTTQVDLTTLQIKPRPVRPTTQATPHFSDAPQADAKRQKAPSLTSKQGQMIARLSRDTGATLAELIELTGWQAHTVRGTISGALRKRLGLRIVRNKDADGVARYRVESGRA